MSLANALIDTGRDQWEWGESGVTIRRVVKTRYANWLASFESPEFARGTPHPLVPQATLRRVIVNQGANGLSVNCSITMIYIQDEVFINDFPPATRYAENEASVRVSILENPRYVSLQPAEYGGGEALTYLREFIRTGSDSAVLNAISAVSGDGAKTALVHELLDYIAQGITEYTVGALEVTKTEYGSSKFADPTGIVGKKDNPGGGYGNAGRWLVLGAARGKEGPWHTLNTIYQLSDKDLPVFYTT